MFRRLSLAAGVCMALAVAVGALASGATAAATTTAPRDAGEPVCLLDVPYVPQSAALCGGAAAAMVLRYWGAHAALAEDFAPQLAPDGSGIRADSLVAAVRARGWTALPVTGTPAAVRAQLAQGRPVIALVAVAPAAFHYVVIVAWANGGVILHDPARAPFRTSDERAFDAAWAKSGRWALLVLPPRTVSAAPTTVVADSASAEAAPPPSLTGCDALVDDAIAHAHAGDSTGAEQRLLSAHALCPASAAPLRGLAGLRFAAHDWTGAARLAELALALDPEDAYTWRLLAGSRFLRGDEVGALRAWNRVSEPRADLARVDGLMRIRYGAVAGQLALPPGRLLTARAYVRARRRLAEIPAQASAQVRLRPEPEGKAQLNVAVLERPLVFDGPLDAGSAGLRALLGREASLRVASPTGNGELWSAAARWRHARPRAELGLAVPAGGGHCGVWRADGAWERQSYAVAGGVTREERRRSALSFGDWIAPDVRLEMGTAIDRWSGRGAHLGLETQCEVRLADDRLALGAQAGRWASLAHGAPFGVARAEARWGPRPLADRAWRVRAGVSHATAQAPLALWPGAGTGSGREELLRAHPLLADGVVKGRAFGRTLVDLGVEREAWVRALGPLQLGWSAFVDAARAWETLPAGPGAPGMAAAGSTPWLIDGGASLRIAGPGGRGTFRVTAAHGIVDGSSALSIGWETK